MRRSVCWDPPMFTQPLESFFFPLSPSNVCDQMRETISFGDIFERVYMEKIIISFFFFLLLLLINAILAFFCTY